MMDVYGFGHVLYFMTFGVELKADSCNDFPPQCPAQLSMYQPAALVQLNKPSLLPLCSYMLKRLMRNMRLWQGRINIYQ